MFLNMTAAVAAVMLVVGCSSVAGSRAAQAPQPSPSSVGTRPSSRPVVATPSSMSRSRAPLRHLTGPIRRCRTAALSGTTGVPDGAGGAGTVTLYLRNVSARPCILRGYVSVELLDAHRREVHTRTEHGGAGDGVFPNPGVRLVRLEPGGVASAQLGWDDTPGIKNGRQQACPSASYLAIKPPLNHRRIVAPIWQGPRIDLRTIRPCGSVVTTTALQPGPRPAKR
jgi:Protein of unknown function (DUF4232)